MTALTQDRNTEFFRDGELLNEKVASGEEVFNGSLVTRASGYCKAGTATAGQLFAGMADQHVDNSTGADGDEEIRLRKKGVGIFAASGLTQDMVGQWMFLVDDQTVSPTPGPVPVGRLEFFESATQAPVRLMPDVALAEALCDTYRVPSDVQTGALSCAAAATWEDEDLVAALNAVLTNNLVTGVSVELLGDIEIITGDAVAHTFLWADGEVATASVDKVRRYITPPVAGSYQVPANVIADADGNIKVQVDDESNVTWRYHLRGFRYVNNEAVS